MYINIKNSFCLLLFVAVLASCTKTKGFGPKSTSEPSIPVTVTNAADYRPEPTVTTSLSGTGAIQIVLSIPASSGRTIKEITKVALATSYAPIQSTGATGFYNTAPYSASGTTATFNSSITEYFAHKAQSSTNPAAKANTELTFRFYFLLTLDDGSVIVTEPVRVLVLS
jgi:hypothetical protein